MVGVVVVVAAELHGTLFSVVVVKTASKECLSFAIVCIRSLRSDVVNWHVHGETADVATVGDRNVGADMDIMAGNVDIGIGRDGNVAIDVDVVMDKDGGDVEIDDDERKDPDRDCGWCWRETQGSSLLSPVIALL